MASRAVTGTTLGAWLIKCDPRVNPELFEAVGDVPARVTSRCVARGYRAALMQEGDPVVLWVSGDGRVKARGIWGVGQVTGPVRETTDGPAVPVDIPLTTTPVTDAALRAAGLDDLEVQRMPAGANPSWVSTEQLARLEPLLEGWHDRPV
jgi:hypothetical protein